MKTEALKHKTIYDIGTYIIVHKLDYKDIQIGRCDALLLIKKLKKIAFNGSMIFKTEVSFSEEVVTHFLKKGCRRSLLENLGGKKYVFLIY